MSYACAGLINFFASSIGNLPETQYLRLVIGMMAYTVLIASYFCLLVSVLANFKVLTG